MHARRIRISFSDPDATESDSSDDASSITTARNMKASAAKTEIVILVGKMELASSGTGNRAGRGSKVQAAGLDAAEAASSRKRGAKAARPEPTKRRYRGVYERQPGQWAAEFRSHRLKVRHWLGTFPTEEEAKAAYDAFEAQFLSLPRGGPPALVRGDDGGDVTDIHSASLRPRDEKKQIVQALMSNTTSMESSARAASASSTPCVSSLSTASTSPASEHARPLADPPSSLLYSFREDEPSEEDLIGLADLADLPLPFLDGNPDFDLGDLSLFDGFL